MTLSAMFNSLDIPTDDNAYKFNAVEIPETIGCRIATDIEGNVILLIPYTSSSRESLNKNFRLRYLELINNVECSIQENGNTFSQRFTILTFKSSDSSLKFYFLQIAEVLFTSLRSDVKASFSDILKKFISIFSLLDDPPRKTVQGLWSELFLIEAGTDSNTLLDYWHNLPEEKFDFNAGLFKVEVKSNSHCERQHTFSAEQLLPPPGQQILIASVFTRQSTHGISLKELIERIQLKITDTGQSKLLLVVGRSLGNSLESSLGVKYDYEIARDSLAYYRHQDIHKIERVSIPDKVSDVRFKSSLSDVPTINSREEITDAPLYKSLPW